MLLNSYETYKDCGYDWLGAIPSHWSIRRLKWSFELKKRPITSDMEIVTAFRDGQVTLRKNRRVDGFTEGDKQIGYQGIEPNDLVIHAMDAFAGAIGVSDSRGKSTPVYSVCKAREGVEPRFFALVLRHLALSGFIESLAKGIRERSTDFRWGDARNVVVPVPPQQEQREILAFLDREAADIDAFIADQEELVGLLHERRAATITQAVTKGLNVDVPMKGSGVEWLGKVPEHWDIAPLKRKICFLTSGSRDWASRYSEEGTPFIRIGNLTRGHLNLDMSDVQHVNVPKGVEGERARLKTGDVLFSITAYLGSVAVVDEVHAGAFISQHVAVVRPARNVLNSRFLGYCVLSNWGQRQLDEQAYGGTKMQLSLADVKRFLMTAPPLEEQVHIVEYLDRETAEIDAAIADARESIELSKERRAALISAAVTGKIDVRDRVTAGAVA